MTAVGNNFKVSQTMEHIDSATSRMLPKELSRIIAEYSMSHPADPVNTLVNELLSMDSNVIGIKGYTENPQDYTDLRPYTERTQRIVTQYKTKESEIATIRQILPKTEAQAIAERIKNIRKWINRAPLIATSLFFASLPMLARIIPPESTALKVMLFGSAISIVVLRLPQRVAHAVAGFFYPPITR